MKKAKTIMVQTRRGKVKEFTFSGGVLVAVEGLDNRPRYGWCVDLDKNPQTVREERSYSEQTATKNRYVVVIPIPYKSSMVRKAVAKLVKRIRWEQ